MMSRLLILLFLYMLLKFIAFLTLLRKKYIFVTQKTFPIIVNTHLRKEQLDKTIAKVK